MKIISGAQTGVDIAALRAAKKAGLETGGYMTAGFGTQKGPRPQWAKKFGLKSIASCHYKDRTRANVRAADLTIRIARNFNSPGERCTLQAIKVASKPYIDIVWKWIEERYSYFDPKPEEVIRQIQLFTPKIINIAGNSEKTAPGIEKAAEEYLFKVFSLLNKRKEKYNA